MTAPAEQSAAAEAVPRAQSGQDAAAIGAELDVSTRSHIAFFNAAEYKSLSEKARGKLPESAVVQKTAAACAFIEALGARLGFPQRTICTAQMLFQRFHLYFDHASFASHEVSATALAIAGKINDTYKRAPEILLASYAIRYPNLIKSGPSNPNGQVLIGHVSESDIDAKVLEADKKKLFSLEKLFLECISFNFQVRTPSALPLVVKLGRILAIDQKDCNVAWRIASDSHRTRAPLLYPSRVVALAGIYLAQEILAQAADHCSLLHDTAYYEERAGIMIQIIRNPSLPVQIDSAGGTTGELPMDFASIEDCAHLTLDLYEASAGAIKTTFGPLFSNSPRSPFDLASSESDSSGGNPGASKKLDQRWSSAPPPLLMTWLMDRLVAAGKSPSDLLVICADTRLSMRKRVYAEEERTTAAEKPAQPDQGQAGGITARAVDMVSQAKKQVREELSANQVAAEDAGKKVQLKRYRFEHHAQ